MTARPVSPNRARVAAATALSAWLADRPAFAHAGHSTAPEIASPAAMSTAVVLAVIRPERRTVTLTRTRYRIVRLAALLVLAVTLAGCGGSSNNKSSTTTSSGTRPTTAAKLGIVQPTPNEVTGPNVKLVVKLTGAKVVPQTTGKLTPDKGHIHVSVDGQLVSMAYNTEQDLNDLKPGTHTVQAEFVAIDHAPFRNRVIASVLFTVKP